MIKIIGFYRLKYFNVVSSQIKTSAALIPAKMEPPVSIFKEVIAVIANLDTLETTASQV